MHEPLISPAIVHYDAQYRAAELERHWKHRRNIAPQPRRRPLLALAAIPAALRSALFPAPPFGADRPLRFEAIPHRLR